MRSKIYLTKTRASSPSFSSSLVFVSYDATDKKTTLAEALLTKNSCLFRLSVCVSPYKKVTANAMTQAFVSRMHADSSVPQLKKILDKIDLLG